MRDTNDGFMILRNCSMNNKILLITTLVFVAVLAEGWIEENPNENEVRERFGDDFDGFSPMDSEEVIDNRYFSFKVRCSHYKYI